MSPRFSGDHDEQAAYQAGWSPLVPCAVCQTDCPELLMHETPRGLLCADCFAPNHSITADDWKRSIVASRATPNLVLARVHAAIAAAISNPKAA
jgi:hypothetical protein